MRVKLTAKHPRPTSETRSPVRSGTSTGRKPVRPQVRERAADAGKRPGTGSPSGFKSRDEQSRAGDGERRSFKPREESRGGFGDRGGFERRSSSPRGEGDERRLFKPRGDDTRGAFGDRGGERRTFKPCGKESRGGFGERDERGGERRPFKPRADDARASSNERTDRKTFEKRTTARDDHAPRPSETKRPAHTESAHKPHHHKDGLVRLSKVMSELGLCSRRETDEWIEKGWVLVNGEVVDTLGTRIDPKADIDILPAARSAQSQQVTILLHKPVGYVSGQAEDGYEPAVTLINPANRWEEDRTGIRFQPNHLRTLAHAGRLDIDSTGLLVLTQDGRIAKQLIGGHSEVDKEYLVRVKLGEHTVDVDKHFPAEKLALLRRGLELDGVPLKTAQVSWQNAEQLRFVLREGKKRQIRRMCELVGLEVVGLKRIRMGHVVLDALPQGQWRYLDPDEMF